MEAIIEKILSFLLSIGGKIIAAILVLIVGHLIIKYVTKLISKSKINSKVDITVKKFMDNFINIALYCILIISVIAILGIPMASIVAVLGSAGLAIGLALQGALSNIAGGIMLIIFKPFAAGDYVDAGGCSGTVDSIGLFYTVIMTVDNKRITIPNSNITSGKVVNYSCEDNRRVDIAFTVAYGSDMAKVKSVILDVINSNDKALKTPEPFVRISNHLDSAVEISTRTWCRSADYWDVFFDITEGVNKAFEENGIQIPFPQMDVHVKQ
ncbi:MAG: mechanosensitive ion channel [Clostridiales bacterium]|nr:mechanosensitive ion channel [Clostridiales bacterium]